MKKNTFKKIIWANLILPLIFLVKIIFYPYSFAPADLSKAIILYDELVPMADNFVVIIFLLIVIVYFISLYLLYKFHDYGRQLFIFSFIGSILVIFSDGYIVFDSLDYLFESANIALSGFTIAIIYFTNLSKEFKKKSKK